MVRYPGGDGVAVVPTDWANRLGDGDCANSGPLTWGTASSTRWGIAVRPLASLLGDARTATYCYDAGKSLSNGTGGSGGGRFGVAVGRPAPTSAGAGGAGGSFGGTAARLAAALFRHLAEAFELEALIVLCRDIELLGRSVGVADGELVDLPGGNLTLIHVRNVHGDGLGAHLTPFTAFRRDPEPQSRNCAKPNHRQRFLQQALPFSALSGCNFPRPPDQVVIPRVWLLAEVSCQSVGADDPGLGAAMGSGDGATTVRHLRSTWPPQRGPSPAPGRRAASEEHTSYLNYVSPRSVAWRRRRGAVLVFRSRRECVGAAVVGEESGSGVRNSSASSTKSGDVWDTAGGACSRRSRNKG